MSSIERRLKALEELKARQTATGGRMSARGWERYFHAAENAQRELHGHEALPDLPRTEEDHQDDLDTLEHVIPVYRASLGWQSEEAQTKLDAWEEQLKERIHGKESHA